ncbi:MAG: GMC family oxidoreductase [Solirubrobacterales bacterium]|nr:GMC family oxidoreductase [Solirubrobacterales bacterium]
MSELSDAQKAALASVCDTVVPAIAREADPTGFWGRSASDLGVPDGVEQLITGLAPEMQAGLGRLLDALAGQGIRRSPSQPSREQMLRNVSLASPEAAAGVGALVAMTLFLHYGAPDPDTGRNPNWDKFGFPGPISAPPDVPKALTLTEPEGDEPAIDADVCIVGSGAGGGVIAATLAAHGMKVVVLEAAGYFNESDFNQLELPAYQQMFWRGGPNPTAEGSVSLQAGTTLGGGTTINWTNCLRTWPWVRRQWAEHGLEDVAGAEFDAHLDAVMERIGANDGCSDLNGPQQRMLEGCEALGWSTETILRNTDPGSYSADYAGYLGFGDQSGSKQSGDRTWLADAQANGAELVANCRAQRILTEDGRASGVEASWAHPDGRTATVTVTAPQVVVACGALESPSLLARSGIGGPAVGANLRLHPCSAVVGYYDSDQQAWWGPPQALLCDEFADTGEGYGFLIETAQYAPGLVGSATPWTGGEQHKELVSETPKTATTIGLIRDRGAGRVDVDADGESVPSYAVTDELDLANMHLGIESQVRMHIAAGARQIGALAAGLPIWRAGDDVDRYLERLRRIPVRAGGYRLFSAHQMGSCRMGADAETSVANPDGELHDTQGVWIGDGSAFPTSSGTNPMITIMALARRTAGRIASSAGAGSSSGKQEVGVGD